MSYPIGPDWAIPPSGWGAQVDYDTWGEFYQKDKIVVHYGGGANLAGSPADTFDAQTADETRVLRSWEAYHLSKPHRGLDYNYAVGQSGRLYRARGWAANGGHWGNDDIDDDNIPANVESFAVVFILGGDQEPTEAAYRTFERFRRWVESHTGPVRLYTHKEVAHSGDRWDDTSCPGPHLTKYVEANRDATVTVLPIPDTIEWADKIDVGFKGPEVRVIRSILHALGYQPWQWLLNRRYTVGLSKAVRRFQKHRGLKVDGVVGDHTRHALVDALPETF